MAAIGEMYWLMPDTDDTIPHPHLVINVNTETVIVCALTSNLSRVSMPGNVMLDEGEGNLPRQSVVEVSKTANVKVEHLGDYIGTLSHGRLRAINAGIEFVQRSFFASRGTQG